MFVILLILLLVSSAVITTRNKSILFSRVIIQSLLFSIYLVCSNLYFICIYKGIGIYGGLVNVTTVTQSFSVFIFIVSGIILTLTGFYPRKVYVFRIYPINII